MLNSRTKRLRRTFLIWKVLRAATMCWRYLKAFKQPRAVLHQIRVYTYFATKVIGLVLRKSEAGVISWISKADNFGRAVNRRSLFRARSIIADMKNIPDSKRAFFYTSHIFYKTKQNIHYQTNQRSQKTCTKRSWNLKKTNKNKWNKRNTQATNNKQLTTQHKNTKYNAQINKQNQTHEK